MIELCGYSVKEVTICDLPKTRPSEFIMHVIPQEAGIPEYFLSAETREDMTNWVECLQFACIETKKKSSHVAKRRKKSKVIKSDRGIKFASAEDSIRSNDHSFPARRVRSLVERRIESTPSHRSFSAAFTPRLGGAEELTGEDSTVEVHEPEPTEISVALIAEGPVTALITQRLMALRMDVRAIVMNRTPEEEDDIPSAWYDHSLREGLDDRIYGEDDAAQALLGCSVLILPSSISLSLVDNIIRTAEAVGVTLVIRLSLCGALDCFPDIQSKDTRICRVVEERNMKSMLLQYEMPYEGLLGFLSPQILTSMAQEEPNSLPVHVPLQGDLCLQWISLGDVADVCVDLLHQIGEDSELPPSPIRLIGPTRITVQEGIDIINESLQLMMSKWKEPETLAQSPLSSPRKVPTSEPICFIRCGADETSDGGSDDPWLRVYVRLLSNLRYAAEKINQRGTVDLASSGVISVLQRAPVGLREFLISLDG